MAKHIHIVPRHKAKEMLKHGEVKDKPLTEKQKGLFSLIAGGGKPSRLKKRKSLRARAHGSY